MRPINPLPQNSRFRLLMLCALGATALGTTACAKGTPISEDDVIITPLLPDDAGASTPQSDASAPETPKAPADPDAGAPANGKTDPEPPPPRTLDAGTADAASDGGT